MVLEDLKYFFKSLKGGRDYTLFEELFLGEIIEDNFIIRADGNISAGFALSLPNRESQAEEEIQLVQERIENSISQLPIGTVIHFQHIFYPVTESFKAAQEVNSSGFISRKMADHLSAKPILGQQIFFFVCFNFTNESIRDSYGTWFSSYERMFKAFAMKDPLKNVQSFKTIGEGILQTLTTQLNTIPGIKHLRLDTDQLTAAKLRYFNLKFDSQPDHLSRQFENLGHSLIAGDQIVKVSTLIQTGDQLYYSKRGATNVNTYMAWSLGKNINCPHIVNTSFMLADTEKELKRLDSRNKIRLGMFNDKQKNLGIWRDVNEFTQNVRDEKKRLVHFNHNIVTWGDNDEDVNYNLDHINTAYRDMNNSIAIMETFNAASYFFTYSPGMALEMFKPMVLSLTDAILHVDFSKSGVSEQKGIILANRDHEPILIDFWTDSLDNKNRLFIGPSGSGKSFMMNTLLSQEIEQGVEVIIIDVGGSYKNLFELKEGKYYSYTDETPVSFNPFLINRHTSGKWDLNGDRIVFLLSVIEILWKKEGYLSNEESSILTKLLEEYYTSLKNSTTIPRLDRFLDFVQQQVNERNKVIDDDYFDAKSLELVLEPYKTGVHKKILNSDTNESINLYKLVCFDLEGIKDNKFIYPIVSLMIVNLIADKISSDLRVRKEIVIDEAWSMLKGKLGEYIEVLFRTIRKKGGAITIVTQGIVELENSGQVGLAVKNNAATVVLLDHSTVPNELPKIRKFFGYTEHTIDLIKSIKRGNGWRELFIMRGNIPQVFKVDVGSHNMAAFSTDALVKAELAELREIGGVEYSINEYVERKL